MIEVVRRAIHKQLGHCSPAYRFGSRAYSEATILAREGRETLLHLRQLEVSPATEGSAAFPVTFSSFDYRLCLCPGTEGIGTAANSIVRREYGHFNPSVEPTTMIDACVYIGDASAYLFRGFPNQGAVALEPNPGSLPLVRQNLDPCRQRAELRSEVLGAKLGTFRFDARKWAHVSEEMATKFAPHRIAN